jgi:hypothetical protein
MGCDMGRVVSTLRKWRKVLGGDRVVDARRDRDWVGSDASGRGRVNG